MKKLLVIILIFDLISCQNQRKMESEIDKRENTIIGKFDTDRLTEFAIKEIKKFSLNHQNETFYGFSIDANLLCLNSIDKFEIRLKNYRKKWGGYKTEKDILNLKLNTGDWEYQGFAEFNDTSGFNMISYVDHYNSGDYGQTESDYAKAMNKVIENLKKSDAFDNLKKTKDFFISRVEHNY
jgi:hypothetical protein